jgi:N-acetylglutamate synthase-like GNAT family acetyltransferase
MENQRGNESPKDTGISGITGKVVRVRHAKEADMALIEGKLRERHLDTGDLKTEEFVVAVEDGEIIGLGRLKRISGVDHVSCLVVLDEKKRAGVKDLMLRHLIEYSGSTVVYAVTNDEEGFSRMGFERCPGELAEKLDITCKLDEGECLMRYGKQEGG